MRARHLRTPLLFLLALGFVGLCFGGCAGDLSDPFGPSEEEEDEVARVEYFENAAVTYYDGGRYDLAERQFRKVVEADPQNKKAKRGLAKSLYMQAAGMQMPRRERYSKLLLAERLLLEVVDLEWENPNPKSPGSRRWEVQGDLAHVYADQADLFDRDNRELQHMIKTDPNADEGALMEKSRQQIQKRNSLIMKAIPLYEAVMASSPNNPYGLAGLAKVNLQMGNDEAGIVWAEKYLGLSQRSQHGWKRELEEYAESVGGMNKVTTEQRKIFLNKIQGAREKEKQMHLMLASVHMRRMEFAEATERYTSVIKIDNAMPAAYLERAQALAALQQYKRAIDDLEEYLKITDPQRHRRQRVNAVQLLDRYQNARARRTTNANDRGAPARPSKPVSRGPYGSPDG